MRRIHIIGLGLAALLGGVPALRAQNVSDLIISEVLCDPDSTGILDAYGRRGGWIELFNTSQGTVKFGGCYLTDDRNDLHKSLIPKTDARTVLGPRQAVLFYAGGAGSDGTFYTSFSPKAGGTVYLVSNDGRTVIDSLPLPRTLGRGQSVQKMATDIRGMRFEPHVSDRPSPGIVNGNPDEESKSDRMKRTDPYGLILAVVSISVVFAALAILWFIFGTMGDQFKKQDARKAGKVPEKRRKKGTKGVPEGNVAAAIALALQDAGGDEVRAAIALALHEYLGGGTHDSESYVLTIRPSENSAWNGKSRMFRRTPAKK